MQPGNFALPLLITIYAIVILGGIGSLTGVILGAIVINASFQFLAPENPQDRAGSSSTPSSCCCWLAVGPQLVEARCRAGGVVVLGVVTQAIVDAAAPTWTGGGVIEGGRLGGVVEHWVLIPSGTAGSERSRTSRSSPPS